MIGLRKMPIILYGLRNLKNMQNWFVPGQNFTLWENPASEVQS